jgi:hypothetical protein
MLYLIYVIVLCEASQHVCNVYVRVKLYLVSVPFVVLVDFFFDVNVKVFDIFVIDNVYVRIKLYLFSAS